MTHAQEPAADTADDKIELWMAGAAVGGGLLLGALIASAVVYFTFSGKDESPEAKSEGTAAAPEPVVAAGGPKEDKEINYEEMLRLLAKRVTEACSPQVAKGQAMRKVLETRASNFTGKAKAFVMNELNSTASALMTAFESEESALLLDMDSAIAAYFPPLSVLMAGLLSPSILAFSFWNHIAQVGVVHLPILALCIWAAFFDWKSECDGIPSIYIWVYTQVVISGILVAGHCILAFQVRSAQVALMARSEGLRARLEGAKDNIEGQGMGLSDVRELFVCSSVLLQQALLAEEKVRRSALNNLVGVATLASLVTTVWDIFLVFAYATMPGQLAFHPAAKAVVAPEDFCGAWRSIIVLRVACLFSILFVLFNLFEVGQWVMDRAIHSDGVTSGLMQKAKRFDSANLGIPVAQTLVRAFLLRTDDDLNTAQLAVASNDQDILEKERNDLQMKLDSLDIRIGACAKEYKALEGAQNKTGGKDDLEVHIEQLENFSEKDMEQWKTQGSKLVEQALEKDAAFTTEATTAELEKMMGMLQDVANQIQESEMYNQAVDQGTAAAAAAADAAAQAAEKAQELGAQAVEAADAAMKSEAVQQTLSQAKEAASSAAAKAQEGVEKAQAAAKEGVEKAKQAAEKPK